MEEALTIAEVGCYGKGLYRWLKSGEMVMEDLAINQKVYKLLRVIFDSPLRDSIDPNFNGMSFEALCQYLGVKVN